MLEHDYFRTFEISAFRRKPPQCPNACISAVSALFRWLAQQLHYDPLRVNGVEKFEQTEPQISRRPLPQTRRTTHLL